MSEYRLAHVTLTCMAVFVVIEGVMIALFREYGLMNATSGTFTPVLVDAVSHEAWIAMGAGVFLLREPVLRFSFRPRLEEGTLESFVALYEAGARLVAVLLLAIFVPHFALMLVIGDLDTGFAREIDTEPVLVMADGVVLGLALSLLIAPRWFAWLAMRGSRRP